MPKDDEFLRLYFVDCQNEMRYRRGVEYKLLDRVMILYPIIITVLIGAVKFIDDKRIFLTLAASMAALLIILTVVITRKIVAEHRIYEYIGGRVRRIWEYFRLFDSGAYIGNDSILDKRARNYGKGTGHLKTLHILWAATTIIAIILLAIGIIRYVT